jgi:hypothetical protein
MQLVAASALHAELSLTKAHTLTLQAHIPLYLKPYAQHCVLPRSGMSELRLVLSGVLWRVAQVLWDAVDGPRGKKWESFAQKKRPWWPDGDRACQPVAGELTGCVLMVSSGRTDVVSLAWKARAKRAALG